MKASFDGTTSAGQITPPYPTGDVLGSRSGEFSFYVIDRDAPQLEVASMPRFVTPADEPITFRMNPPSGLTNVELHYTVTMPGFILDEGRSSALTYTYNAQNLHRDFPNLDLREPAGITGVDTITLSFLVSGTDNSGARKHFARVIVIQGEELLMPDQKASPPAPRRRRAV